MKKVCKPICLLLAIVSIFAMAGCKKEEAKSSTPNGSTVSGDPSGKKYKVGIVQQLEHQALDAATEGFQAALVELLGAENVEFDYQNAQNEPTNCASIATKFVNDKVDLIMANATTALQSAAAATSTIPIVGTSITDYVSAGVIESNDAPGGNVTGASDLAPIDGQIDLLIKLCPDAKTVGIVYCSSEANSVFQAEKAEEALKAKGLRAKVYTVSDSNDIQAVVTTAVGEVDAIYIPTDNTLADNMEIVKNITVPAKIPVIAGEENMCKVGGLATLSISYYSMSYSAGKIAYDILVNGANPATTPIAYADEVTMKYNKEIADLLSWPIPDDLVAIGE